jgi:hypothetical protein
LTKAVNILPDYGALHPIEPSNSTEQFMLIESVLFSNNGNEGNEVNVSDVEFKYEPEDNKNVGGNTTSIVQEEVENSVANNGASPISQNAEAYLDAEELMDFFENGVNIKRETDDDSVSVSSGKITRFIFNVIDGDE